MNSRSSRSDRWDARFLTLAAHIAGWSKDASTKVGAVIVGPHHEIRSTGYNGLPPGANDDIPERHERPTKYLYYEHSERNALYFAAMNGVRVEGCTLYVTLAPCVDCARGVIRSGLSRVVCPPLPSAEDCAAAGRGNWREACQIARDLMLETGVVVDEVTLSPTDPTAEAVGPP